MIRIPVNLVYLIIALLSVTLVLVSLQAEGCFGNEDGILKIFIALSEFFLIMVLTIAFKKKKARMNKFVIFLIICMLAGSWMLSFKPRGFYKSMPVLIASDGHHARLILRKDNTFTIEEKQEAWKCYFSGTYQLRSDTLVVLDQNESLPIQYRFYSAYVIRNKKLLVPYINRKVSADSSLYLSVIQTM